MAKFSKPVAFNPEKNEKDKLMVQHVKKRNFSGYVKKLIWKDMNLENIEKEHIEKSKQPKVERAEMKIEEVPNPAPSLKSKLQTTASERIQQLKSQMKKQQTSPSPLPFMPSSPRKH